MNPLLVSENYQTTHSDVVNLHNDFIIINVPSGEELKIEDAVEEVLTIEDAVEEVLTTEDQDEMFQSDHCSSEDSCTDIDSNSDLGYESHDSPGSDHSRLQMLFPDLL